MYGGVLDHGDEDLATMMRPEDVASALGAMLRQPRRMRTAIWTLWSRGLGR